MCVQELMIYFSTSPYKGPARQAPQCCSLAKLCPILFDQGPSLSVEFAQTHVHGVGDTISFLCCPLLLLPSILPSIRVFSNELSVCIRQPKYWRRQWYPTPVLLPGKSHGWRSLVRCSPWGHEESDTTERLHFHLSLSCIGEGNGNPLQCSCLENPRDGGAWWAAVYGVAQSRT